MMKYCPACKQTLPSEQFGVSRKAKDGLQTYCRACARLYGRIYHESNRDKRIAYRKAWGEQQNAEKKVAQQPKPKQQVMVALKPTGTPKPVKITAPTYPWSRTSETLDVAEDFCRFTEAMNDFITNDYKHESVKETCRRAWQSTSPTVQAMMYAFVCSVCDRKKA